MKKKPKEDIRCPICLKMFRPLAANSIYCSKPCVKVSRARAGQGSPRFMILERDRFACIYCGRSSFKDTVELQVDHVRAQGDGGTDTAGNLATCCRDCNLGKRNHRIVIEAEILAEVACRNKMCGISPAMPVRTG